MKETKTQNRSKWPKYWEEPYNLLIIKSYARRYYKLQDISDMMGIHRSTLYEWLKVSKPIRDTIMIGRQTGIAYVENVLEEKAKAGEPWAVKLYLEVFGGSRYDYKRYIGLPKPDESANLTNEVLDVLGESEEDNDD